MPVCPQINSLTWRPGRYRYENHKITQAHPGPAAMAQNYAAEARGDAKTVQADEGEGGMMKTCPDCRKSVRKYDEPTLDSSGYFLDQIIVCSRCDWCGVDSRTLTRAEAEKWLAEPKQLRMEI